MSFRIKVNEISHLTPLQSTLVSMPRERSVPQEMRDSNIITLYKNKGDKGGSNDYRVRFPAKCCRENIRTYQSHTSTNVGTGVH